MTPSHGFRGKRHAPARQDPPSPASSDLADLGVRIPRISRARRLLPHRRRNIPHSAGGWALGRTAIRIAPVFDGCPQRGYDTLSNGDNS